MMPINSKMWNLRMRQLPALCLCLLFVSASTFAQSGLIGIIGVPDNAVKYQIPGVGFVNLNNGNLHIELPLRTVKDRNGVTLTTSLIYDNSDFLEIDVPFNTGDGGGSFGAWAAYPGAPVNMAPSENQWASGLRFATSPVSSGEVVWTSTYTSCGNNQGWVDSNYQFIDSQGTVHPFWTGLEAGDSSISQCYPSGFQGGTEDGSGYWVVVTNQTGATVYDVNGNAVVGQVEDRNGNQSFGFDDELGRPSNQLYYSNQAPGWTIQRKTIYVWTALGVAQEIGFDPSGQEGITTGAIPENVISSITRPDGRTYTFQYDDAGAPQGPNGTYLPSQQGHNGTLTNIQLPTGGNIVIQSEVNPAGGLGTPGIAPIVLKSITTPDGTWNFSYSTSQPYITATAPVDPQTGLASQTTCNCPGPGYPTTVSTYAGAAAGTPLRSVNTQYSTVDHPSSITTTVDGTVISSVTYTYPDICTPRIGSKKEFDGSGNLLRETDVTFYTSPQDNTTLCYPSAGGGPFNDPYLQNGHHIVDIPQSATVYGAGGCCSSPIAQTNYTYDSTSLSTSSGSAGNLVLGLTANGSPMHDDQNFGASMTTRGNVTGISQMTTPGTFVTTRTNYYNILGELIESDDVNGNKTYYDYTDSWNNSSCLPYATFAYPTTVTNAKNQVSQSTYNSCDGSVASVKDPNDIANGRNGTVYSYDGLQQVFNIAYPDHGNTGIDYGPSGSLPEVITTTVQATPDPNEVSSKTLDGLGRTSTAVAANGATTQTVYDSHGRVYSVSNPYFSTSDPTYGVTTYTYDGLDRTIQQLDSDGSSKKVWSYNGNVVTFTDEAGNQWQRTSDALGQLTQVLEPNGSAQTPSLETDYQYDPLNNLVQVDQWGGPNGSSGDRVRTFVYDGLSRLTNACNPESIPTGLTCSTSGPWSDSYSYLSNGSPCSGDPTLPCSKTDARGITTTYGYEALNRLFTTSYSDGTPIKYHVYDTENISIGQPVQHFTTNNVVGRLSVICVWVNNTCQSMTAFSYDAMGRVAKAITNTPSNATTGAIYTTSAGYDLAGNITSLTYPDGRTITQSFNGGLLQQEQFDNWNGTGVNYPYFNYAQYWPDGSLMSSIFGSGAEEDFGVNSRLQPSAYSLKGPQAGLQGQILMSKQLCYYSQCGSGSTNNGNIYQITDLLNTRSTLFYSYDSLNRLTGFVRNFVNLGQTFSIDAFGNLSGSGGSLQNNLSFNTNNQINNTGYGYDAAGNLTTVPNAAGGSDTYILDAEDRITNFDNGAALYTYDADGNRVRKDIGTGGNNWTEYLYFGGQPISELNSDGSWSDSIFANGKRIARSDSFDQRIHIEGTSNAVGSYAAWYIAFHSDEPIQAGDKLSWRQFQNGSVGGIGILFGDGTSTNWTAQDTDGQIMNNDSTQGWHFRTVDLTPYAGKGIQSLWITADSGTPVGSWLSYFADISIYGTNGFVQQIFYRQPDASLSYFGGGDESNTQAFVERGNTAADSESPWNTTTYYSADQVGSTWALSAAGGWLVSTDTYYPFGQEAFGVPADNNHYKFAGKERDFESSNDYFGARYYSSAMTRFMSPDWSSTPDTVPYADFNDPQSLNLYAYAGNNPIANGDSDGHVYQVCDDNGHCSKIDDPTFENDEAADRKNGETFAGGQMYHMEGDRKVIDGTYSWQGPDLPGDAASNQAAANMIGNGGMGMVNMFMKNMAYTVAGGLAGRAIGWGWEAASDWAILNSGDTVVYRSVNAAGDVDYVGITNDIVRRGGEHLRDAGRTIQAIPGLSNLTPADARAVEQALIETHGIGSAGTLTNRINSIASTNPGYARAVAQGMRILQSVGYFK